MVYLGWIKWILVLKWVRVDLFIIIYYVNGRFIFWKNYLFMLKEFKDLVDK